MSVPLYYLHFLTELKYCANIESTRKKNVTYLQRKIEMGRVRF